MAVAGKVVIGLDLDTKKFDQKWGKIQHDIKKKDTQIEVKIKDAERTEENIKTLERGIENLKDEWAEIAKEAERFAELKFKIEELGEHLEGKELVEYMSYSKASEEEQRIQEQLEKQNKKRDEAIIKLNKQKEQLKELQYQQQSLTEQAELYVQQQEMKQQLAEEKVRQEELKQQEKERLELEKQRLQELKQQEKERLELEKQRLQELKQIEQEQKNASQEVAKMNSGLKRTVKSVVKWGLSLFGISTIYGWISSAMSTLSSQDKEMAANIQYIKWVLADVLKPVIKWIIDAVMKLLQYINYIAQAWFGVNLFEKQSVKAFKDANNQAKKLNKTMAAFDEMNVLTKQNDDGTPSLDLSLQLSQLEVPKWLQWIADNKNTILSLIGAVATFFAASTINRWVKNLTPLLAKLGRNGGLLGLLESIMLLAAIDIIINIISNIHEELGELAEYKRQLRELNKDNIKQNLEGESDINKVVHEGNRLRLEGWGILNDSYDMLKNFNSEFKAETLEDLKTQIEYQGIVLDKELQSLETEELTDDERNEINQSILQSKRFIDLAIEKLELEGEDTSNLKTIQEKYNKALEKMPDEIKKGFDEINSIELGDKDLTVNVDANTTKATGSLNQLLDTFFKRLKYGWDIFMSGFGGSNAFGYGGGGGSRAKGGIYYPPKLASGGIINRPGAGLPYHNAIIGERGAEAVVPLTDSQQMDLLGEAIARHMVVDLTSTINLDGRTLARQLNKVNSNTDFLLNR